MRIKKVKVCLWENFCRVPGGSLSSSGGWYEYEIGY